MICQESFKSPYKCSVHQQKHREGSSFRCPLCSYQTLRISSILQHINRQHLKKFLYNCNYCGKGFQDGLTFKEHENHHLGAKPFVCVVCEKEFAFSRYLQLHQTRYHTVTIAGTLLKNQCPVCRKVFSKSITLEKHTKAHKRTGPREKVHLCDNCGKGFATKTKLTEHYRVHTGDKPFVCSYCEKSFTKRDYLVLHERIHSGEKPYMCQFCRKCFNQDASLRIHVRIHTGERPYICQICKGGFISRAAMKVHQKNCRG